MLEASLGSLFDFAGGLTWAGGGVPVGAGQPDLILAKCQPAIGRLRAISHAPHILLGYLRSAGFTTPERISVQLGRSERYISELVEQLVKQDIIHSRSSKIGLSRDWHDILEDVTTIEVKVSNWRRAIHQAIRNTIVAHKSYIALPDHVAFRVRNEELVKANGLGILSISQNGDVTVARRARKAPPKVWSYYYSIACLASQSVGRNGRALHHPN
jgi:hypothetical protein